MDVRSRNHVKVTGRAEGPVVVLAHGFGCGHNMWRLVAPALERDFTVVLFDHVGAGRAGLSAWSEERYSGLDADAEDVIGLSGGALPTVVVQCTVDAIAPPEVDACVQARIAGSELVTLQATGHCPQPSAPEATAQAIAAFAGARR
jgi:sigma-B regulation protein RsbQ